MADKTQLDVVLRLKDEMSGKLAGVRSKLSKVGSSLTVVGRYAAIGMGALTAGIGAAGGMALSSAADLESLKVSLKTAMGGDSSAAGEAFKTIENFATQTPFQLLEVTDGFVKLKNMGLDPSEKALRSYGDTASAMGKPLNQMVEAVADAATGEFERLKEFGIKTKSEGDNVSFTFKGITTTVGKNSKEIEDYLIALGETEFAGGMEEQSKTLKGRLSTLKDTFSLTMAAFATDSGLLDVAKNAVERLTLFLDEHKDEIIAFFQNFANKIVDFGKKAMEWIIPVYNKLKEFFSDMEKRKAVIVGVLSALTLAFIAWGVSVIIAVGPILLVIAAVGLAAYLLYKLWSSNFGGIQEKTKAVMSAIKKFYNEYLVPFFKEIKKEVDVIVKWWRDNWDTISLIFSGAWLKMKGLFKIVWALLSGVIKIAIDIFTGNWGKAWEDVKQVFKGVWDGVKDIFSGTWSEIKGIFIASINWLIGKLNNFIGDINKMDIPDWVPGVGGKGINIKPIPRLATGTNYIPQDTLAVLHEGEAVIPKEYNPSAGGLEKSIVININGEQHYYNEQSVDNLIDKIRDVLSREQEKTNWGIA